MTSRRPMTRSFSGNGRTSSFSEEEGSSSNGRSESRNPYLSNVRPENRSTLCSVMAQLTEDIQPSFETTLKSKAVSENCNVKFTCVVSGYPAPELKWYKDDMEIDRYCGLPKYEIRRNGKTHTLHIYNCTLDDAAIYQVSASNSKGIVSCSGVLEVGTMNEYKIHQRFFAKLKQKAEKKKKDLEENKKDDKENIKKEKPQSSPERPPRKRPIPPPKEKAVVKEPEPGEQLVAVAEPNGVDSKVMETDNIQTKNSGPKKEAPPSVETLAPKKIKISNGVDVGVNGSCGSGNSRSHMMGNGGENCYDGGISLAQFLAETIQTQAAEEKQNSSRVEQPVENNVSILSYSKETEGKQKEREEQEKAFEEEYEREKRSREAIEREVERETSSEMLHTTAHSKHHSKVHKDHDHHNIQASISSMLHTVKDFFFGKSKKDSHDQFENKDREFDHDSIQPCQPETPPSLRLQRELNLDVYKLPADDVVSMETDKPKDSLDSMALEQQSVSMEVDEQKPEDNVPHTELTPAHILSPETTDEATGQIVQEANESVESTREPEGTKSSTLGEKVPSSGLQVLTETKDKDSLFVTVCKEVPVNHQELDCLVVSSQPANQAPGDDSSPRQDMSVSPQTKTLFEREEPLSFDKMTEESKPDTEKELSPSRLCEEEKAEVKSSKPLCSVINRSEMTDLATSSLEERIEPCKSIPPDQVLSALSAAAVDIMEEDYVKEEAECSSLAQEMNVGYPPSAAPVSLQSTDLKLQPECPPSIAEESAKFHILNSIPTPSSSLTNSEEKCDLKDVLNSVLAEAVNVNLCHSLNTQEHTILEGEKTEARNECSQSDIETEKSVQEFWEPKIVSVAPSEGSSGNGLDENNITPQPDGGATQLGWPSEDIPQIQISTIEDTRDVKTVLPDVNQNKHFVIPKIEIVGPELKECTEPLTVLAPNEPETEAAILQKHDTTHVSEIIIQNQSMTDFQASLPTEEGMQNDYNVSQSQKVKEVAQLDDKTEMLEPQPSMQTSEQLPQIGYASIPLINVSCTDDKENGASVNALQPIESPTVPLFAVPPISITFHESDSEMRRHTHSGRTEAETSVIAQRGTENDVMTVIKGRKHNNEDVSEKSIKENTPSLIYEAPLPKVGDNMPSVNKTAEDKIVPDVPKIKPLKEAKIENEDLQRNRCSVERLSSKPPAHPSLSPASLRKYMGKVTPDSDSDAVAPVPVITVGDHHSDRADEDLSGGSTPTSPLSCESSPRMKRRDSLSLIRSATPEELASGARRKIFIPKTKDDGDGAVLGIQDTQGKKETPYMSPSQARRAALLQASMGQHTPPMERRSPLLGRRKSTLEVPKVVEETPKEETVTTKEEKPAEKRPDPLKAPQVIRKIRGEPFPDASGHLKLWCQFFNVLSDSTIKWFRDEEEILEVKRSGGDESQVALAIVLASSQDCGVYGCTIKNEYGTDTTDFLLSVDILSEILLRDDLEVGEEIEMTPLLFTKGLADCGNWGNKYFGRIMTETANIGEGCAHKASRVKVIYGLDPIFDSGSNCVIKVQSPIAYGTKEESNLAERNQEITKQECKVQNMIREYCKIFAAEARVIENFGHSLEVIPQYLMYRPANSVPYATVEADLAGVFRKYCTMEPKGRLITRTTSEVEQKCSTFQHWIHQWTHGNLLVTQLEGVEAKLTNVRVVTKSKGYQGLTECGSPELFDQFLTHHQCNYYCGLLGLRPLSMDNLLQPTKMKGSRSPQLQRKGHSPQLSRKANSSPKVTRKVQEPENNKSETKPKPAEIANDLEMR